MTETLNDDIKQKIVGTVSKEKRVECYVEEVATGLLESFKKRLLISEGYDNIALNWTNCSSIVDEQIQQCDLHSAMWITVDP